MFANKKINKVQIILKSNILFSNITLKCKIEKKIINKKYNMYFSVFLSTICVRMHEMVGINNVWTMWPARSTEM